MAVEEGGGGKPASSGCGKVEGVCVVWGGGRRKQLQCEENGGDEWGLKRRWSSGWERFWEIS